ncbi:hypothetical protein [Legionella birminghamensis]|nr:hypothetical protein [Legionella birminghamensis]
MPFELGIDYACQHIYNNEFPDKKILILDTEEFRFKKGISDLSGCDIKKHNNDVGKAIKSVRDWLFHVDLKIMDSGNIIWQRYNEFSSHVYEHDLYGHSSIDEIEICELKFFMENYLQNLHSN